MKKVILWIEDFDNATNQARKKEGEANYYNNDELKIFKDIYKEQVVLKKNFYDAMKYIIEKHGEYDCVILDINMKKNFECKWDFKWDKFSALVKLPEEKGKVNINELTQRAGYYFVVLLYALGFPKDRIFMLSAFGNSNNEIRNKFEEAGLHPPCVIEKGFEWWKKEHEGLNKALDEKYLKNKYFYTRFMVMKIYNIVEKSYEPDTSSISKEGKERKRELNLFNKSCEDNDKRLEKHQILELYENLIDALPIFEPFGEQDKGAQYLYRLLKQFSEPFEARFTKDSDGAAYRIVKLFRNWSTHFKFDKEEKMQTNYFIFLFLLESMHYIRKESEPSSDEFKKVVEKIVENSNKEIKITDEEIIKRIEEADWEFCAEHGKEIKKLIPDNMIEVFHAFGSKEKNNVKYEYLWEGYIGSCCEKKIAPCNHGVTIEYEVKKEEEFPEIKMLLLRYAYYLYEKNNRLEELDI